MVGATMIVRVWDHVVMQQYRFSQIDVFGAVPLYGNPLAVVHDADAVTEEQMAQFAQWTNLSETTFICKPATSDADYRVRIFTPTGELPFAGHPILGTAHAWACTSDNPARNRIVQECGIGTVELQKRHGQWAFASPPLRRSGEVSPVVLARVIHALGMSAADVVHSNWVDNGAGFLAIMVPSAQTVLKVRADFIALDELCVGIIGPHAPGGPADFEVRAFAPSLTFGEDPVTGSLNAGIARWLIKEGLAAENYTVRQGTALGRLGDVHITTDSDGTHWVGGSTTTIINGTVTI